MSQPLKIKLRLTAPSRPSEASTPSTTPSLSATPSPAVKHGLEAESPPTTVKKARPNPRNRRPNVTKPATTEADGEASTGTGAQVVDDSATANTANKSSRNLNHVSSIRKDILKFKDVKPRHWSKSPLVFYTLGGTQVQLTSWRTESPMQLNKRPTEPVTVSEIDQLFSSTGAERDFRPFLCTQPGCSKSFTSFDQLQTHETNMHGTKKLICGIDGCHKSFVTTGQLTKHRKMVHFRAARKAKLAAAAAASETPTTSSPNRDATPISTPAHDSDDLPADPNGHGSADMTLDQDDEEEDELMDEKEESVDIGISED